MTDIHLLPLPDWMECLGEVSAEDIRDYARDNVARATALLRAEIEGLREQLRLSTVDQVNAEAEANDARAEIEALRTELDRLRGEHVRVRRDRNAAQARAERMEKALRLIESAKGRGFGIDYARGVAQSVLAAQKQEGRTGG